MKKFGTYVLQVMLLAILMEQITGQAISNLKEDFTPPMLIMMLAILTLAAITEIYAHRHLKPRII